MLPEEYDSDISINAAHNHVWPSDIPVRIQQTRDMIRSGHIDKGFQTRLLNEARHFADASLELRRMCNDCVPLLRMPLEILGSILDLLVVNWPPFGITKVDQYGQPSDACTAIDLGWINIGHVSHRLRVILLARRQTWASSVCCIPSSRARDQILSRCGDAPLDLDIHYSPTRALIHPAAVVFALQHLPQARRLVIRENKLAAVCAPYLTTIEPALFSQGELPHLEMLELDLIVTPGRSGVLTPDVCELPNMTAPRLTSLHLRNIFLPFPPSNITKLSIIFDNPTYLHTPTQFFDLLRQCEKLQALELQSCIPWPPIRPSNDSSPTIAMPSLKRLILRDEANHCVGLWRCMVVPQSTVVLLHLRSIRSTFTLMHSHIEVIPTVFSDLPAPPPARGLSVFDAGVKNTTIVLFTEHAGLLNTSWTGIFREGFAEHVLVQFRDIISDPPHFMQLLSRISSALDVTTISTLELRSTFQYDPPSWSASLMPFTQLRTLYIEDMPRPPILLSLIAPEQDNAPEASFVLPHLQFLWLSVVDLRPTDDLALDRLSFSRIFSSRIKRGARIEHLRIGRLVVDKSLAESVIPRLRALVPLVECENIFEG